MKTENSKFNDKLHQAHSQPQFLGGQGNFGGQRKNLWVAAYVTMHVVK